MADSHNVHDRLKYRSRRAARWRACVRIQDRGEVPRVTDAHDLHAGVVPKAPGRKGDRGEMRPQVAS
jgi:hypothetical protein